jgi:hypothetical protein
MYGLITGGEGAAFVASSCPAPLVTPPDPKAVEALAAVIELAKALMLVAA